MILSLICSNFRNFPRSLGTNMKWLKQALTEQFLTKVAVFRCFYVCYARPPQVFQVQAKISTLRPVFPDYLSISYDYGIIKK